MRYLTGLVNSFPDYFMREVARIVDSLTGGESNLSALGNSILWLPGVDSSSPCHVATWAEVMEAFQACNTEFTVFVDDRFGTPTVPAGTYALDGRMVLKHSTANSATGGSVSLADGAVLQDLKRLEGSFTGTFELIGNDTSGSACITFTAAGAFRGLELRNRAGLRNDGLGPMILATAAAPSGVILRESCILEAAGNPIISVPLGAVFSLYAYAESTREADTIIGAGTLQTVHDDTFVDNALPNFTGTIIDQSAMRPQNGTTANRPTATATGQFYFDTTIGKPIWWSGAAWVDATGAGV